MATATRIIRQQFIGIVALALLLVAGVEGATGDAFILGQRNREERTSVMANTGNGAALALRVKAGRPPLRVNSSVLVARLNAERLQGMVPGDFAPAGQSYTKAESDLAYAPASGSPNYLPSGGPQLIDAVGVTSPTAGDDFYRRTFAAPADGFVLVQFVARCGVNSSNQGSLRTQVGAFSDSASYGLGLTAPAILVPIGCTSSTYGGVSAGASVTVAAKWVKDLGNPTLSRASVIVLFLPD